MLNGAVLARRGKEALRATIYVCRNPLRPREERFMQTFHYQGYQKHLVEHKRFAGKAMDLKTGAERDGFMLALEIANFLKAWLQNHITETDKRQGCFGELGLR